MVFSGLFAGLIYSVRLGNLPAFVPRLLRLGVGLAGVSVSAVGVPALGLEAVVEVLSRSLKSAFSISSSASTVLFASSLLISSSFLLSMKSMLGRSVSAFSASISCSVVSLTSISRHVVRSVVCCSLFACSIVLFHVLVLFHFFLRSEVELWGRTGGGRGRAVPA